MPDNISVKNIMANVCSKIYTHDKNKERIITSARKINVIFQSGLFAYVRMFELVRMRTQFKKEKKDETFLTIIKNTSTMISGFFSINLFWLSSGVTISKTYWFLSISPFLPSLACLTNDRISFVSKQINIDEQLWNESCGV